MKKFYTLVLAFIFQFSFAADAAPPIANAIGNQIRCDDDGVPNGFTSFNLTTYSSLILAGNPSPLSNYSVAFFADAALTNFIANPSTYVNVTNPQFIYVQVTNNVTAEFATTSFNIVVAPTIVPTFNQLAPICQNSQAPVLPTTSTNAVPVTGTWSPAVINTSIVGVTTFSFTPNPGQCAINFTMNITIVPSPIIVTPFAFATCDDDGNNNGYYTYPLDVLIPGILNGQNPANHTVTFHHDQSDAQTNTNAIPSIANYQTQTETIWIRVTNNLSGCFAISSFNTVIEKYPTPVIQTNNNSNVICVDYDTNNISSSLTLNAINATTYFGGPPPNYNYQWYRNGVLISGANSPFFTINTSFPNATSANYVVKMTSASALGCPNISAGFVVFQSGQASPVGIGYSIANNSGNQTLTAEVQGYGTYEYAIDNGIRQSSPVFSNVSLGTHTIEVFDTEGGPANSCNSLQITNVEVNLVGTPPPTGNTTQSFSQGATLANLLVNGQNLRWYPSANATTLLPLNTVLVNGTTYHASQKIGGYESASRLPVLVQLTLNTTDFESDGLSFYPNPVRDNLKIHSKTIIKDITVYTILGQEVINKNVNTSDLEFDVAFLNQGTYFVKITSECGQNTIKIIKE